MTIYQSYYIISAYVSFLEKENVGTNISLSIGIRITMILVSFMIDRESFIAAMRPFEKEGYMKGVNYGFTASISLIVEVTVIIFSTFENQLFFLIPMVVYLISYFANFSRVFGSLAALNNMSSVYISTAFPKTSTKARLTDAGMILLDSLLMYQSVNSSSVRKSFEMFSQPINFYSAAVVYGVVMSMQTKKESKESKILEKAASFFNKSQIVSRHIVSSIFEIHIVNFVSGRRAHPSLLMIPMNEAMFHALNLLVVSVWYRGVINETITQQIRLNPVPYIDPVYRETMEVIVGPITPVSASVFTKDIIYYLTEVVRNKKNIDLMLDEVTVKGDFPTIGDMKSHCLVMSSFITTGNGKKHSNGNLVDDDLSSFYAYVAAEDGGEYTRCVADPALQKQFTLYGVDSLEKVRHIKSSGMPVNSSRGYFDIDLKPIESGYYKKVSEGIIREIFRMFGIPNDTMANSVLIGSDDRPKMSVDKLLVCLGYGYRKVR